MRARLLVFSLVLLMLPWMGLRYLQEIQNFLLEGHQHAQLLTARALATVMGAYPQAFDGAEDGENKRVYYAPPLTEFPVLDGYFGDWKGLAASLADPLADDASGAVDGVGEPLFHWQAGTWQDGLYLLLRVSDSQRVYRQPRYPRLDTSDHVRLRLIDDRGKPRRLTVSSDGPGEARVLEAGRDWRYPLHGGPRLPVSAYWQEVDGGYQIELRLPLDWGHSLALAVVDVDDTQQRIVERMQWSPRRPPGGEPVAWRLLGRSPPLQSVLRRDWQVAGVVTVVDSQRWVRAASEGAGEVQRLPTALVGRALAGEPASWIAQRPYSDGSDQSMAVWPSGSMAEGSTSTRASSGASGESITTRKGCSRGGLRSMAKSFPPASTRCRWLRVGAMRICLTRARIASR